MAEVRRDWSHYFPHVPAQSGVNRRLRWLWGALEQLRQLAVETLPPHGGQQIDTSALPVKHGSRVRGPDSWVGPNGLVARFGWDAAHAEWFYGFRLVLRTDLQSRIVRSWGIVPAAVDERAVADGLVAESALDGLLLDGGFHGSMWASAYRQRGIHVVLTLSRAERRQLPADHRRSVAVLRNRIETTTGELTGSVSAVVRRRSDSNSVLFRWCIQCRRRSGLADTYLHWLSLSIGAKTYGVMSFRHRGRA